MYLLASKKIKNQNQNRNIGKIMRNSLYHTVTVANNGIIDAKIFSN